MAVEKKPLLFRCSGIGALMTKKQGTSFTEVMRKELAELNQKVIDSKALTPKQEERMRELKQRRDAPVELSDTAKQFIRDLWLYREKGIKKEIKSKYLEKGKYSEEAAISLLTKVDGVYYKKNTERKDNGVLTGECDIFKVFNTGRKIVYDTKCCWNAETFMNSAPSIDNEWQGRGYMELWDADEFHLKFCLVDCPEHIYADELYYFKKKKGIIDEDLPEYKEMIAEFRRGYFYSENPLFTESERVKTFVFKRDETKIEDLYAQIHLALEYYPTITLNSAA